MVHWSHSIYLTLYKLVQKKWLPACLQGCIYHNSSCYMPKANRRIGLIQIRKWYYNFSPGFTTSTHFPGLRAPMELSYMASQAIVGK